MRDELTPEAIAAQKVVPLHHGEVLIIGIGGTLQCHVSQITQLTTNPEGRFRGDPIEPKPGFYLHIQAGAEHVLSLWGKDESTLEAFRSELNTLRYKDMDEKAALVDQLQGAAQQMKDMLFSEMGGPCREGTPGANQKV